MLNEAFVSMGSKEFEKQDLKKHSEGHMGGSDS